MSTKSAPLFVIKSSLFLCTSMESGVYSFVIQSICFKSRPIRLLFVQQQEVLMRLVLYLYKQKYHTPYTFFYRILQVPAVYYKIHLYFSMIYNTMISMIYQQTVIAVFVHSHKVVTMFWFCKNRNCEQYNDTLFTILSTKSSNFTLIKSPP